MSREEFLKTGPAQCDEDPDDGGMVCDRQRVTFAAWPWTQFFEFNKDGLNCIAFGQALSLGVISAALAWFEDEKLCAHKCPGWRGKRKLFSSLRQMRQK